MSSHSGHGGSLRAPSRREGGAARRVLSSIERRDPDRVNPTGTHAASSRYTVQEPCLVVLRRSVSVAAPGRDPPAVTVVSSLNDLPAQTALTVARQNGHWRWKFKVVFLYSTFCTLYLPSVL